MEAQVRSIVYYTVQDMVRMYVPSARSDPHALRIFLSDSPSRTRRCKTFDVLSP
jgi:hypothetical protein